MLVEIRILTGARAGQVQRFEQAIIAVGRHASTDLRFDPQQDLDVSGRHAEIRGAEGRYAVHDNASTNGTFVNGKKVEGSMDLKDGDTVLFGAKGPEVEVHFHPTGSMASVGGRSTEQRIAIAVSQHTAGLKRFMIAALVLVVAGVAGAFAYGRHVSTQRVQDLQKSLEVTDSLRRILQAGIPRTGDTALFNTIQRNIRELQQRLPTAKSEAEKKQIAAEIDKNQSQLRRMVQMDLPAIRMRNAPAVVILIAEVGGKPAAGTGFSITPEGLLITNRHNVRNAGGQLPSRIAVKFTDTRDWLPAHVVSVSDSEDLALIQVDRPGPFPVVEGVSSSGGEALEGMSVVTIGYPSGYDTPMEGTGNDFEAKSTLSPGTVSKKTSSVLQIDSYATHGSSGSPVFSARGLVVGVVYGGQSEAGGKIVYAVPPERLAAFIPPRLKSILRD